jgi:hypothetical protein
MCKALAVVIAKLFEASESLHAGVRDSHNCKQRAESFVLPWFHCFYDLKIEDGHRRDILDEKGKPLHFLLKVLPYLFKDPAQVSA